jgi:hypothetical protein
MIAGQSALHHDQPASSRKLTTDDGVDLLLGSDVTGAGDDLAPSRSTDSTVAAMSSVVASGYCTPSIGSSTSQATMFAPLVHVRD